MAITMVREPSETPNINNVDDFVGLRYAYGDQNGYVKGFGNECSYTVNGSTFHINSGRLVLQGVECDIDANGIDITIDSVSATRYYVVYLQVNLSTNQVSILSTYSTSAYPTIGAGDDLTANNTGTATIELYRFVATSGTISNVSKTAKAIRYINENTRLEFTDGMNINAPLGAYSALLLKSGSTDVSLATYKDVNESLLGGIGCDSDKDPVFYNTETSTAEKLIREPQFNTDNETKIGDYIIPKMKLIWSGEETVTSGGSFTIPSLNLSVGDTIVVYFKSAYVGQLVGTMGKITIHITSVNPVSAQSQYFNCCELLFGGRSTGSTGYGNHLLYVDSVSYNDGSTKFYSSGYIDGVSYSITTGYLNTTFTKIYKIYE